MNTTTTMTTMERLANGLRKPMPTRYVRQVLSSVQSSNPCETSASHVSTLHTPEYRRYASTTATTTSKSSRPRTAIFFPGQGVQKVGMLDSWLKTYPTTTKPFIEELDSLCGYKLSEIISSGPSNVLTETIHAQPAIMATSILILRILERDFGFTLSEHVDVTLGHSLGEFAALVAGGYVSFGDSLYLVRKRAEAMAEATRKASVEHGGEYGMVALVTDEGRLTPLIAAIETFLANSHDAASTSSSQQSPMFQQVSIANINSKNQIVLSGNIEKIKGLLSHVRQFGGYDPRAVRLKSDSPFHSPLMKPAALVMEKLLDGKSRQPGHESEDIVKWPGSIPCISNVTARPFSSKADLKELWERQATETVRWWDSIRYLDQEEKVRRWIGIGPGKVGRNLVGKEVGMRGRDEVKGGGVWGITDPSEIAEVLRGLEETDRLGDLE